MKRHAILCILALLVGALFLILLMNHWSGRGSAMDEASLVLVGFTNNPIRDDGISDPGTSDSPQVLVVNEVPNDLRDLLNEAKSPNVGRVSEGAPGEMDVVQDEMLLRDELQKVNRMRFETPDLQNKGSTTILSLLETYYWALREGDFEVYFQCHSAQQQQVWEAMARAWGETNIAERFKADFQPTKDFEVTETTLEQDSRCVLKLEFSMFDGKKVYELLSVSKSGGEWKVNGERGYLIFGHSPGKLGFRTK
jgi:Domain of unknown function (DUF4878)